MRKYIESDKERLTKMLKSEGIKNMGFEKHTTWVTDEGFFTIREEHGFPYLIHFYVDKDKRSINSARKLIKSVRSVVRTGKMLIHSKKSYLDKFIQYYFKVKPYARENSYNFYLVEVTNG